MDAAASAPASDDYASILAALGEGAAVLPANEAARLAMMSARIAIPAADFDALVRRWSGASPTALLRALALVDAGRALLTETARRAGDRGLLAVIKPDIGAVVVPSAAEAARGGAGLDLAVGFHPSPFGEAILVTTAQGLAGLGFVDGGDRDAAMADMQGRWPKARLTPRPGEIAALGRRVFEPGRWRADDPVPLDLLGTAFEVAVWRQLLAIPMGGLTTYGAIARALGRPEAARAVGAAVGRNPVSFVVPCHRAVGQAGALTGYYWGLPRKRVMLAWELARTL